MLIDILIPAALGFLTFASWFFYSWDGIVERKYDSKWWIGMIVFGVLTIVFGVLLFI